MLPRAVIEYEGAPPRLHSTKVCLISFRCQAILHTNMAGVIVTQQMQIYYRAGAKSHRALCIRNLPKISWQRKLKGHTYVECIIMLGGRLPGSV
jgi:hypothetical protein